MAAPAAAGQAAPSSGPSRPRGPPIRARVCIIGGGIGGLTAARALLDAGADVAIFEKRSQAEMLAGPSGLGVAPNAIAALDQLSGATPGASLAQDVAAAGTGDRGDMCMMNRRGLVLKVVPQGRRDAAGNPLDDMGAFGVNVTRPALQRTLFAALPPGTVTCGLAFTSAERLPDGRMQVRLAPAGGGEERSEVCDVLVGADGIFSAVRSWMDGRPDAPGAPRQPSYRGYNWYRGLVDVQASFPGGAEAWRERWGGRFCVALSYGDAGAAISYEVAPGTICLGVYAPSQRGRYKEERALPPEQAKALLQRLCEPYPFPFSALADAADLSAVAIGELWTMPLVEEVWGSGCCTLIGDAAHAMLPMLGQGASQSMEDAVVLAQTLHSAYGAAGGAALGADELAAALRRFEAARKPRAHAVAKRANDIFTMGVGEGGWFARLKRDALFWLMPVPVLKKAGAWILEFPAEHRWGGEDAEAPAAAPSAA